MITTVTLNPAVDQTIYISKLQPNDTNRVIKVETDAGGKGVNCSRLLSELEASTRALTFLGGKNGDFIKAVLEREGVSVDVVATDKPTRTAIAVEEDGDRPPTTFNEKGGPIEHRELVELLEKAKDVARESSYMVFGGSVPVGVNPDVYRVLIQIASAQGAKSVLDADGEPLVEGMKAKPFMIKPNRAEAERYLGKKFESKSDVARGALLLAEEGIELVVISLGKQGAIACYEGMIYDAVPPEVKTISTIGSGDSMIAGILYALEQGMGIEEALRWGSAAGAATAMSTGSEIGCRSNVEKLLSEVKVTRIQPV